MQESNYWTRLSRKRISRRTLLSASATTALGGAAALVVGCGGGGDSTGGTQRPSGTVGPLTTPVRPSPGAPRTGGSVTWGRGLAASGIDPHIDLTGLDIDTLLYSYLYSWNPFKEEMIFNNFATSLEQPDKDHLEFIFHLRPGVKIHAGGPGAGEDLSAEDCIASFERRGNAITAPDKRFPQRIAKKEAPDPLTFQFTMSKPFVPAIREMAIPLWAMVPKKVLEKYQSLAQVAYGSGPFTLKEFRGSERVVLQKHPEYFLNPRPYLDGLTYIVITDNSSLLSAFKSGQHDISGATLTRRDAEDLNSNENYVISRAPSLFYPVIHMKMKAPFDDIRVRKAVNLALDRDEIIAFAGGEGEYNGPIQWPQFKWALPQDELRGFYKSDPAQARALLEQAGYANGFNTRMKLPKLTGATVVGDIANIVKAQLGRVGINVELNEVELGSFIGSTLLSGNFEMVFFPNLPYDEPDRPLAFYHSLGITGTGNWTNYSNKALDVLIEAQSIEFDEVKRKEIILKAQRLILQEHGPQLTLTGGYGYSAHWNYIHFPFEFGQEPPQGVGPNGADLWTERA